MGEPDDELLKINVASVKLNPNTLSNYTVVADADKLAEQEQLVRDAAAFLKGPIISKLAAHLVQQDCQALDGTSIGAQLHQHGVNMRYLGAVTTALDGHSYLQSHCIQEMIARSVKHLLNTVMREAEPGTISWAVANFLNCFLGDIA